MSVFQRGQHWHFEFMHAGQVFRKACGRKCHSKTRALQIEAEARARALNGETPTGKRKMLTLAEAAKAFLDEREAAYNAGNLARNTLRHYRNAWDSWLSDTPLASMRVNQIAAHHIAAIQFPGGPFTTKNARQSLTAILGWCRDRRLIASVPRVKGGRVVGRKIRITPEIEAALRQHMSRDVSDVFTVMLDAVMRPAEVMAMQWQHVNWGRREYFVPDGKTDAARRTVPMSERMYTMLKRRQCEPRGHAVWVFPSRIHAKGHLVTVAKQYRAARKAAGIDPSVKLYCARHTGASELSEMGVDLLTLRTLLGHEDISTTNKYLHGSTDKARDVINERNTNRGGLRIVPKLA
jgi:integrase